MAGKVIGGKHYPHDLLSEEHKCRECQKPIKARLVAIKQAPPGLCYKCFMKAKGKHGAKKS